MRKSLVALLFAAALPTLAFGMPGGMHDGPHGGKRAPHMFQELDLTKEQQREMRKLMGEQMKQRQAITQRYLDKLPEAERQAMQKDLDASREKTHQSMRALLKPEQQKAFDEGLKKMEEKRAERAEFLKWKAERDQKN
ncbi:Spy/CpxP family protein refolding chaperone [Pseudomonas stutzeri]|jgi:Spy/CpxP family protein refolding chaperone|uniref:Spy/CpxP family protein refolding chaperone n=1 Tax=Stutzerimonas stutzeri TaxID=316 RepID=A0ABD4XW72_STUST|nr:Spy/CpxP family protein refolding chaperone [Stutzerimonas stutzeri]MBA4690349.1 Spy/CpxP family protein refolding chaperone [Pseudomonas sp.]AVX13508.1 periplasmic heavy metal sensor [Stutzerimonas stutzeri]MBH3355098.1 Spy/CpxP family protein refolding chaperone [Stutzerimonas stutzeri]MBK3807240.1 periplasmic heavy metal sensor [Stutzerimonas stutzeri]MBK3851651.1 periplasmic heavy metal sensor [Stutzerimonas stutzeri]